MPERASSPRALVPPVQGPFPSQGSVGIGRVCWDQTVPGLLPGQWGWESHQQLPKKSTHICQCEFLAA